MKQRIFLFLGLIAITRFSAFCQVVRSIQNIGIGDVEIIELAKNGDVWVGTQGNGVFLNKFGSSNWIPFNSGNTTSIHSDTITGIIANIIADTNNAFIGTTNGVAALHDSTWRVLTSVPQADVKSVIYRPDSLWVITTDSFARFDSMGIHKSNFASPWPVTAGQNTSTTCTGFWEGTNHGCYYTDNGTISDSINTTTAGWHLGNDSVNAIALDGQCINKYVGTRGGFSVCPGTHPCRNYTTATNPALPEDDITSIAVGCHGQLILGTSHSGLVIFKDTLPPGTPTIIRITTVNGLPSDTITAVAVNPTACNSWVGMPGSQVAQLDSDLHVVQTQTVSSINKTEATWYDATTFPQPAAQQINFVFGNAAISGEFYLTDINGRQLEHSSLKNSTHFISDVSSLADGIYYYHIVSSSQLIKAGKIQVLK